MALKKLSFSVNIAASPEKVWRTLWEDASYRKWTSVFSEGSYAVSDWKEGSKILFLNPEGSGLASRINKLVPNELMSFQHLGEVKGGKEQPPGAASEAWTGAMENYYLQNNGNGTGLKVEMDVTEAHAAYFNDSFPRALQKVKELAEQGN